MSTSTLRVLRSAWVCLAIGSIWAGRASAEPLAILKGWAGEGHLIHGNGHGPDLVLLIADVEWKDSIVRDPSRYQIRITLPDGQVATQAFPTDRAPYFSRRFQVLIPASALRNLQPGAARIGVEIVDPSSGLAVSNSMEAGIKQYPRPKGDSSANDPGPFGWGSPLEGTRRVLPNPGPDGLRFARIVGQADAPGFFIATSEASVGQVRDRLPGYSPKAGRSDEFSLENSDQPAVGLTPSKAGEYLKGVGTGEDLGIVYRLPTRDEWTRAALGLKLGAFWWGDEATFPEGANFLGAEPALAVDATGLSLPPLIEPTYKPNPFGLFHTFGNVAEWATVPAGGFVRMGGHFRTEPVSPLPEVSVASVDEIGPDPFVGVRPAVDLSPSAVEAIVKKKFEVNPALASVAIHYDPDLATVSLTGKLDEVSNRRSADRLLEGLWFVSAVDNKIETPTMVPNQLAILGGQVASARKVVTLGETFLEIPIKVRWLDPLPVAGSEWWVNIGLPGGGHSAYKLGEKDPGLATKVVVVMDRAKLARLGLNDSTPMTVRLSLGGPAPASDSPNVVSNEVEIRSAAAPR